MLEFACRRREVMMNLVAALVVSSLGCKTKDQPTTQVPTGEFGFASLQRRIRKHVADKPRRRAALDLVAEAERELKALTELFGDWRDRMSLLDEDLRNDPAARAEVTRRVNDEMSAHLMQIVELAVEGRTFLSEQEWVLIFPNPTAGGGG